MANVTYIPPKDLAPATLRVAAYCRVSSDSSDQLHSYATQIKAYTDLISQHDGWEMVDIYADAGLTGTRMDKREDFNRMLADCRKGRIDKVLVKSISRFARNTRDCLATLRELSTLGVTVQFEKEKLDTGTLTTELMVSISGALAQQESISISQNQRMSYRRRMERGEFITCKAPFGYRLIDGRDLEIIPEEAEQVRWVFDSYLNGKSLEQIADQLTAAGIPAPDSKGRWSTFSVRYLLKNEKYIGDALCQKCYSTDFPFTKKRNQGERDQYYIEQTHPAIVSHSVFERVQKLMDRRGRREKRAHEGSPLQRKIYCGGCGSVCTRRISKNGYTTWSCYRHEHHGAECSMGRIPESEIHAAFVRMYNKLHLHAGLILTPALHQLEALEEALHRENPAMVEINRAVADASEQTHKIAALQADGFIDADACASKLATLDAQITRLRAQRRRLLKNYDIDDAVEAVRQTVKAIRQGPERLESFDEALFGALVERITAESKTALSFRLYGGIEIREQLREVKR